MESLRLQKPFEVTKSNHPPSSSTVLTAEPRPQVPHPWVWFFGHFRNGDSLQACPWQPVLMLDNPLPEEISPNTQSKHALVQPQAVSPCPVTCYVEETPGEDEPTWLQTP